MLRNFTNIPTLGDIQSNADAKNELYKNYILDLVESLRGVLTFFHIKFGCLNLPDPSRKLSGQHVYDFRFKIISHVTILHQYVQLK